MDIVSQRLVREEVSDVPKSSRNIVVYYKIVPQVLTVGARVL